MKYDPKGRILLVGRYLSEIRTELLSRGAQLVDHNPDVVICYGGDGTFLGTERLYPGVPKFAVRDRVTAPLCDRHALEKQCDAFFAGTLSQTPLIKIGAFAEEHNLKAINDIFIHNENLAGALRYKVEIDGELYAEEIMGDGLGLATPYGSTGYYQSVTGSLFRVGIGIAFSNSTEQVNHLVLDDEAVIKITILRGTGLVIADNNPEMMKIYQGSEVILRKVQETTTMLGVEMFMCPECRRLRHGRRREYISGIKVKTE